jgi:chromosome partitioning protein
MASQGPAVVSFVNLKGGVGKTALSVNFAAYCAKENLRTLLIDLDPQTNATFSCISVEAWQKHAKDNGTVANLFGLRQQPERPRSECHGFGNIRADPGSS